MVKGKCNLSPILAKDDIVERPNFQIRVGRPKVLQITLINSFVDRTSSSAKLYVPLLTSRANNCPTTKQTFFIEQKERLFSKAPNGQGKPIFTTL